MILAALLFLAQVSNVQGTQQVVPITVTHAEGVTMVCPPNVCVCVPDNECRIKLQTCELFNDGLRKRNKELELMGSRLLGELVKLNLPLKKFWMVQQIIGSQP